MALRSQIHRRHVIFTLFLWALLTIFLHRYSSDGSKWGRPPNKGNEMCPPISPLLSKYNKLSTYNSAITLVLCNLNFSSRMDERFELHSEGLYWTAVRTWWKLPAGWVPCQSQTDRSCSLQTPESSVGCLSPLYPSFSPAPTARLHHLRRGTNW